MSELIPDGYPGLFPDGYPQEYKYVTRNFDLNNRAYKELVKRIDEAFDRRRALMMYVGQGSTFGFGESHVVESGEELSAEKSRSSSSYTKHLTFWGRGIGLVGTTKLVSCVGVYFEIKGNRFFCAHINTWHSDTTFYVEDLAPSYFKHTEIKLVVLKRLRLHSEEFGWKPEDVLLETLKLVFPQPRAQGNLVPLVITQFLGLKQVPQVLDGYGFVVMPGSRAASRGPCMILLRVEVVPGIGYTDVYRERVPEGTETIPYEHGKELEVLQQWCYTWQLSWHHITSETFRFDPETYKPISATTTTQELQPLEF